MSPPNGHAKDPAAAEAANYSPETRAVPVSPEFSGNQRFSPQEVKDVCAALEIPFDSGVIDWRVTNATKNGKLRGQVIPYADQRAYTDRLNALFTPRRVDPQIRDPYQRQFRAQQRPEDRCQGAGHL